MNNEEITKLEDFIKNYKANVKKKNNGNFPRFAQVYISRYEEYLEKLKSSSDINEQEGENNEL